jgi:ketosteroid isomerase-like protein
VQVVKRTLDHRPTTDELAGAYADAWARHDLDDILRWHTPDSVFQLHDGSPPAKGADAVRSAFALVLAIYPDLAADEVRTYSAPDHLIVESRMRATTDGVERAIDAVDVFLLVDGLIARKDTYLDTAAMRPGV